MSGYMFEHVAVFGGRRRRVDDPVIDFQLSTLRCSACGWTFYHRSLLVTEAGPKCARCGECLWAPGVWQAAVAAVRLTGQAEAGRALLNAAERAP